MRSLLTKRLHLANRQRSKLRAGALSIGGDVGKTIPDARQAAPGVKRGLTQAELEDQGFRTAGEGEIGLNCTPPSTGLMLLLMSQGSDSTARAFSLRAASMASASC